MTKSIMAPAATVPTITILSAAVHAMVVEAVCQSIVYESHEADAKRAAKLSADAIVAAADSFIKSPMGFTLADYDGIKAVYVGQYVEKGETTASAADRAWQRVWKDTDIAKPKATSKAAVAKAAKRAAPTPEMVGEATALLAMASKNAKQFKGADKLAELNKATEVLLKHEAARDRDAKKATKEKESIATKAARDRIRAALMTDDLTYLVWCLDNRAAIEAKRTTATQRTRKAA